MLTKMRPLLYWIVLTAGFLLWLNANTISQIVFLAKEYWPSALTMVFGSFVAGSTPMGGGAVAFPVFNKILLIDQQQAKIFSLFIQSIGMSFATLLFISLRVKIYWQVIVRLLPTTLIGLTIGLLWEQHSEAIVKFMFSCFAVLVGIMLLQISKLGERREEHHFTPNLTMSTALGLVCGFLAALIGTGADTLLFFVLVFLCRFDVKQTIPTTVAYMAITAIFGSIIILTVELPVSDFVVNSWLIAAPVVAIGAPLGGYIMRVIDRRYLFILIEMIILTESISTLLLGKLSFATQLFLGGLSLLLALLLLKRVHERLTNKKMITNT